MFDKINEFAFRNLNKAVMIETHDNKHVGTLVDCMADKFILLEVCAGTVRIPMCNIIGCHSIKNINNKMSPERFKELLDELDGNSLNTLKEKNHRYSVSIDGDSLHNFRSGAEIMGKSMAEACWGYVTKHLTALRDMVMKNDFSNREDFLEKCQDTINYIRFLWCIGNDEEDSKKKEPTYNNEGYKRQIEVYLRDGNELLFRYTQDTNPDVELFNDYFVIHYNAKGKRVYSTFTYNGFYAEITETFDGILLNKQIVDRKGE